MFMHLFIFTFYRQNNIWLRFEEFIPVNNDQQCSASSVLEQHQQDMYRCYMFSANTKDRWWGNVTLQWSYKLCVLAFRKLYLILFSVFMDRTQLTRATYLTRCKFYLFISKVSSGWIVTPFNKIWFYYTRFEKFNALISTCFIDFVKSPPSETVGLPLKPFPLLTLGVESRLWNLHYKFVTKQAKNSRFKICT